MASTVTVYLTRHCSSCKKSILHNATDYYKYCPYCGKLLEKEEFGVDVEKHPWFKEYITLEDVRFGSKIKTQSKDFRRCRGKNCRKIFVPTRSNNYWCSVGCKNRHNVAAKRQRERELISKELNGWGTLDEIWGKKK